MTTDRQKKEVPDVLAGQPGTSGSADCHGWRSADIPSIAGSISEHNTQIPDLIVRAIRILAQQGRQIREARESSLAASAKDDQGYDTDALSTDDSADAQMNDRYANVAIPKGGKR